MINNIILYLVFAVRSLGQKLYCIILSEDEEGQQISGQISDTYKAIFKVTSASLIQFDTENVFRSYRSRQATRLHLFHRLFCRLFHAVEVIHIPSRRFGVLLASLPIYLVYYSIAKVGLHHLTGCFRMQCSSVARTMSNTELHSSPFSSVCLSLCLSVYYQKVTNSDHFAWNPRIGRGCSLGFCHQVLMNKEKCDDWT